jgi:hypothetical protein
MSASQLKQVLLKSGRYYQSGALFYHKLWREHLRQLGFVVISVEKLDAHDLWVIRLRITSSAQLHLLLSSPPAGKSKAHDDRLEHELRVAVRRVANTMGQPIRSDYLAAQRTGAYCTLAFIWKPGRPGRLLRTEKKPSAFSFLIRPWLKRNAN